MQDVWQVIVESFPQLMYRGLTMTIPLTLISFAIALVIAVIVALVQFANVPVLKQICRFYIWVIRGTPLLVQLYVIFFGLPSIGVNVDAFPAAVIVFSINEGAYAAETIRGALESVPAGQMEAGRCVGMSYVQIMWHVILPQTFRTAFPALGNELISMVKDTSLRKYHRDRDVLPGSEDRGQNLPDDGTLHRSRSHLPAVLDGTYASAETR